MATAMAMVIFSQAFISQVCRCPSIAIFECSSISIFKLNRIPKDSISFFLFSYLSTVEHVYISSSSLQIYESASPSLLQLSSSMNIFLTAVGIWNSDVLILFFYSSYLFFVSGIPCLIKIGFFSCKTCITVTFPLKWLLLAVFWYLPYVLCGYCARIHVSSDEGSVSVREFLRITEFRLQSEWIVSKIWR